MHLFTIIWTLTCAGIILGYSIYLLKKSSLNLHDTKENISSLSLNSVELISFDLKNQSPSWSFKLNVPQITEDILFKHPILFYLETDATCVKLPFNNAAMGYTAFIYKNTGKVYLTFKSMADGVSNYCVPPTHVNKLKILIIKSCNKRPSSNGRDRLKKSDVLKYLQRAGVNINDYEDTLGYLSNIASINFKGHFQKPATSPKKQEIHFLHPEIKELSSTG